MSEIMKDSIEEYEHETFNNLPETIREHLQIATNAYNLAVNLMSNSHNKPLTAMNDCLRISLVMLARIANDLRSVYIISQFGYGAQACAITANLWELAWQLVWVTGNENAAHEWLKAPYFTSGGPDPKKCLNKYLKGKKIKDFEKQVKLEELVYSKLCAMKHGNPKSFRFHSVSDWEKLGTIRLGPDLTDYGQKSLCYALFMAAQLTELALQEVARNHSDEKNLSHFCNLLATASNKRKHLLEKTNSKWKSFP